MTSWRSGAILGLFLLTGTGYGAADEGPPRARRAVELPAVVDFGDGPRLPLTSLGGQLGIIVTITGEHVNIVRPDGSELRLKGAMPEDVPLSIDRPVLLLSQADAWAAPEDLARLLGVAGGLDPEGGLLLAGRSPRAQQSLETFEVAKPVVVSHSPVPTPEEPQPRRLPKIDPGGEGDRVFTDVAPIEVGLGVTEVSSFSGPGMAGIYQEMVGPGWGTVNGGARQLGSDSPVHRILSYFTLDVYEGDRTYILGDISDPLFGASTGIEMRSALSDSTSVGAAVLVPDERLGVDGDGQLALRAEAASDSGLATEVSIATDGSYSLSGRWERPGTSLRSDIIESYGIRRRDFAWEHEPLPAVTLSGRFAEANGAYDARASLMGLHWRLLGRARLGLERARGVSAGEAWGTDALSLSLLRGRTSGAVRYVLPSEATGREGLEWHLTRFDSSGRQVFLNSSAPTRGEWASGRSYRLGASWPIQRNVRLRAALDWEGESIHPEGKIEWRPGRDKVISLRYGVFDSGLSGEAAERALVLQASFGFGSTGGQPRGTGRVFGRVKDNLGQAVADVALVLEEVAVTFTRSDGTYEFRGVDPGRQTVRIDRGRLHADLGGALTPRVVCVRDDAAERADFVVTRLCQVSGSVYVQSASGEHRNPLANVVLELSDGQRATTNGEGGYSFVGLNPGRYTVSLASTMDASTLTPLAPTSWSFNLAPGDQVSGANFAFERRERPIIFEVLRADN